MIFTNTDKGAAYLNLVESKLYLEKHSYDEASKGNGCLLTSAPMGIHRNEFFDRIYDTEFETLVWNLLGENRCRLLVKKLKYKLGAMLGR